MSKVKEQEISLLGEDDIFLMNAKEYQILLGFHLLQQEE